MTGAFQPIQRLVQRAVRDEPARMMFVAHLLRQQEAMRFGRALTPKLERGFDDRVLPWNERTMLASAFGEE